MPNGADAEPRHHRRSTDPEECYERHTRWLDVWWGQTKPRIWVMVGIALLTTYAIFAGTTRYLLADAVEGHLTKDAAIKLFVDRSYHGEVHKDLQDQINRRFDAIEKHLADSETRLLTAIKNNGHVKP